MGRRYPLRGEEEHEGERNRGSIDSDSICAPRKALS